MRFESRRSKIQQYRNQEKIEKVILRHCEIPDMSGFQ